MAAKCFYAKIKKNKIKKLIQKGEIYYSATGGSILSVYNIATDFLKGSWPTKKTIRCVI